MGHKSEPDTTRVYIILIIIIKSKEKDYLSTYYRVCIRASTLILAIRYPRVVCIARTMDTMHSSRVWILLSYYSLRAVVLLYHMDTTRVLL